MADETLQGQLYRPDTDQPIYRPEFYNHNANFSIIVRDGDRTSWYDYDCCQLLNFDEMEKDHVVLYNYGQNNFSKKKYHNNYFLRIIQWTVDATLYDYHSNTRYLNSGIEYHDDIPYIMYYRISPCGRLIVHCEDCVF